MVSNAHHTHYNKRTDVNCALLTMTACYAQLLILKQMEVIKVEKLTDIKKGDTICVTGDILNAEPFKVQMVKVSETDGTEIIFDKKRNRYFNLGMYLEGKSWVKEIVVIR